MYSIFVCILYFVRNDEIKFEISDPNDGIALTHQDFFL